MSKLRALAPLLVAIAVATLVVTLVMLRLAGIGKDMEKATHHQSS